MRYIGVEGLEVEIVTSASASTADVVQAFARFRASDSNMHQRVRATASLGENELRVLQFLLDRVRDGVPVKPSDISRELGISSASTTAMLDRLERQGNVERVSHPTDRRSLLIAPTPHAEREVADLVDAFDLRVAAVVDGAGPEDRRAVLAFLDAVAGAADDIAASPAGGR